MEKIHLDKTPKHLSNSLMHCTLVLLVMGSAMVLGLLANRLPKPVPENAPASH
jgi:thiamine phosphate synthase YjbQ (UPF0047 family)